MADRSECETNDSVPRGSPARCRFSQRQISPIDLLKIQNMINFIIFRYPISNPLYFVGNFAKVRLYLTLTPCFTELCIYKFVVNQTKKVSEKKPFVYSYRRDINTFYKSV